MTMPSRPLPAATGFAPMRRRRWHLNAVGRAALMAFFMAGPALSLLLVDSPIPITTRFVGWVLWVASLYPTWQYFNQVKSRPPIPFLPVIGLLYAVYYARPLVFGSYNEHWR